MFLALTSRYCIKLDNKKFLRTYASTSGLYLTSVTSDEGISDCNEATPTEYF